MDLFEKFEKETFSVFSDKSMLNLDYLPSILVARRGEEEYFGRIFVNGVRDNYLPPVIRVTGPPGSGKTVTVVSVCDKFQSYKPDFVLFSDGNFHKE